MSINHLSRLKSKKECRYLPASLLWPSQHLLVVYLSSGTLPAAHFTVCWPSRCIRFQTSARAEGMYCEATWLREWTVLEETVGLAWPLDCDRETQWGQSRPCHLYSSRALGTCNEMGLRNWRDTRCSLIETYQSAFQSSTQISARLNGIAHCRRQLSSLVWPWSLLMSERTYKPHSLTHSQRPAQRWRNISYLPIYRV